MKVAGIDMKKCNPPKDAARMKKHNSYRLGQGFLDDYLIMLSVILLMYSLVTNEKFFYATHQGNGIGRKVHEWK